jgi:hypothetical protein
MAKKKKTTWKEPLTPIGFNVKKKARVLSLDPGMVNFGFSVSEYWPKKQKVKLIGTNLIANTIREPKVHLGTQKQLFQEEIQEIITEYGPFDLCIAERYQIRGIGGGTTIECINLMLGIVMCTVPADIRVITAATWKNAFNRTHDLDEVYTKFGKTRTPHEFDAFCIGLYRLSQVYGLNQFSFLTDKMLDKLIHRFLTTDRL